MEARDAFLVGYRYCICRDCPQTTIGVEGTYCWQCEDAGCPEKPGAPDVECDGEHSYGGADLDLPSESG